MIETLQQGAEQAVSVMQHSHSSSTKTLENASTAHEALEEITAAVAQIIDMNTQIASAAEEQTNVSEMIGASISQIASLAEESMTSAEQNASAASGLSETGAQLDQMVQRFVL